MKLRILFITVVVALFLPQVSDAGDEWITTGTDKAYPREMYFVGIGMSEKGFDEAKSKAMIEIKQQISVDIKSSITDEQMSLSSKGEEIESKGSLNSQARLSTDGTIQGVEIVRTAQKGKVYYALAVVDKGNFERTRRALIAEAVAALREAMEKAHQCLDAGDVRNALSALSGARGALKTAVQERTMLSAVGQVTEAERIPFSGTDIDILYDRVVASLQVKKVSGDQQEISEGSPLPFPFVIEVAVSGKPTSMIPFDLFFNNAKSPIMTRYSDEHGRADFALGPEVKKKPGQYYYVVRPGIKGSPDVDKALNALSQRFSYAVIARNPVEEKKTMPRQSPHGFAQAIEQEYDDFLIQLTNCKLNAQNAVFEFTVTNTLNQNRTFCFNRHLIQMVDNAGSSYTNSRVKFGSEKGEPGGAAFVESNLMYDIPIKAKIEILNVSGDLSVIKALQIGVSKNTGDFITFKDISVR